MLDLCGGVSFMWLSRTIFSLDWKSQVSQSQVLSSSWHFICVSGFFFVSLVSWQIVHLNLVSFCICWSFVSSDLPSELSWFSWLCLFLICASSNGVLVKIFGHLSQLQISENLKLGFIVCCFGATFICLLDLDVCAGFHCELGSLVVLGHCGGGKIFLNI